MPVDLAGGAVAGAEEGTRRRSIADLKVPRSIARFGVSTIVPIAFVLVWWLTVLLGIFPESVLPSPVSVAVALVEWAFGDPAAGPYSGTMLEAIYSSGMRVLVGFAVAASLGILIGVPTGFWPLVGRLLDPMIHLLRPIPVTAWVPLSLVFFGFGFGSAVYLIALGAFFPIVVNTIEGVRGASKMLLRVGSMLGARGVTLVRLFVLPASMPSIFVGLRLGIGIAWVLVIVAELLSVKAGIGYTLLDAYSFNRYDVIIAAMIMLGILGFLSDRLIVVVESVLLRWHREISIHGE